MQYCDNCACVKISNYAAFNTSNSKTLDSSSQRFIDAMDDDLNTSAALAVLFDLARPLRTLANRLERESAEAIQNENLSKFYSKWKLLVGLAKVIGLQAEENGTSLSLKHNDMDQSLIEKAIATRTGAKLAKDFAKADQIRDELRAKGIELIDKPKGITDWFRI